MNLGDTGNWLPVAEGQEGSYTVQSLLLLRNTGNKLPVPPVIYLFW